MFLFCTIVALNGDMLMPLSLIQLLNFWNQSSIPSCLRVLPQALPESREPRDNTPGESLKCLRPAFFAIELIRREAEPLPSLLLVSFLLFRLPELLLDFLPAAALGFAIRIYLRLSVEATVMKCCWINFQPVADAPRRSSFLISQLFKLQALGSCSPVFLLLCCCYIPIYCFYQTFLLSVVLKDSPQCYITALSTTDLPEIDEAFIDELCFCLSIESVFGPALIQEALVCTRLRRSLCYQGNWFQSVGSTVRLMSGFSSLDWHKSWRRSFAYFQGMKFALAQFLISSSADILVTQMGSAV
ncbi:hypothetical protein FGO68_gene9343 [Halteria grandinella]|uniref:Uncharacterized protein n=1 Tax=Halteria grandinella TaxID=5974 RepID=A0A8J8P3R9_HALGN|nr:hypothetical protein FGO68_gene9343 [Halteria grandinella]